VSFADHVAAADRAVQRHLGSVTVGYQPAVGAAVEVMGMFDEAYVLLDQGQAGVEQVSPVAWLRLEDLPIHPDDDEPILTIEGKVYRVRERQTDGTTGGTIRLLLHLNA
jgi:hypothetical protein